MNCYCEECQRYRENEEIEKTTKICRRCKNFNHFGNCDAAVNNTNILTGMPFTCSQLVSDMRMSEAYCGSIGRWFVKK